MNKAFVREDAGDADDEDGGAQLPPLPAGSKNYLTPQGYARLRAELKTLVEDERPKVVDTIWFSTRARTKHRPRCPSWSLQNRGHTSHCTRPSSSRCQ